MQSGERRRNQLLKSCSLQMRRMLNEHEECRSRQPQSSFERSLNNLDDDTLLCMLRLLPPHHRAIARLAGRCLNAFVGPVANQLSAAEAAAA
jgi:hypothetical protein